LRTQVCMCHLHGAARWGAAACCRQARPCQDDASRFHPDRSSGSRRIQQCRHTPAHIVHWCQRNVHAVQAWRTADDLSHHAGKRTRSFHRWHIPIAGAPLVQFTCIVVPGVRVFSYLQSPPDAMADEQPRDANDAPDDDDTLAIFQAIESSKIQIHENEMRKQRERTIAGRAQQTAPRQTRQLQQRDTDSGWQQNKEAKQSLKPALVAPKGIPSSMIVSQAKPQEGVYHRPPLLQDASRASTFVMRTLVTSRSAQQYACSIVHLCLVCRH
jgi:hypothetical protein